MRFTSQRDLNLFTFLSKEMVNRIIDVSVIVYCISNVKTTTNIYGEGKQKTWLPGVEVPCLVNLKPTTIAEDAFVVNSTQRVEFAFLRKELQERNLLIEEGCIIEFYNNFYEADNVNENNLVGGQPGYSYDMLVDAHLTADTQWHLVKPTK